MKPRIFAGMAAAALVLGLLYAYVEKSHEATYASGASGAPFLPTLASSINDAHALKVQHKDKTYTITRTEKGWGMDTKNGYPVDAGKVRSLLLALKDAEPIEEKTSDPALYEQIGVEEPDAPESESTRVTVLAADGKELASVIVGDRRSSKGGMSRAGSTPAEAYYVRRSGEAASWLVQAKLQVEAEEGRWLDRTILNVDRNRLRAAEVENADGERVFVSKTAKDATNFDVAGVPEGRELRYAGIANTFGSALSNLTLDDVVPASDVVFDEPPTASTTFWTFDGLRIDVTVQERDEKLYAKIDASYDDAGATAAGAPVPPPPPPPAEPPAAEGDPAADPAALDPVVTTPEVPPGPTPEEVQKEVEDIRARASTWVYVLPTWKKSSFVKRMDELLKELTPPAEEGATPPLDEIDGLEELLDDQTTGVEDDGTTIESTPPPVDEKDDGATEVDDGSGEEATEKPPPQESPPDEPKPEEPPPKDDGDGDQR